MKNLFVAKAITAVAIIAIASFVSCNRDINPIGIDSQQKPDVIVENGRLAFKSSVAVQSTLKKLVSLGSEELIADWESGLQFNSLRRYNENHPSEKHLADMDLPLIFKAILNSEGEYMMGDSIVWFNKGYNYFIPNRDEKLLASIKLNPASYEGHQVTSIPVKAKQVDSDPIRVNHTNLGTMSGPNALYQKIWAVNGETGPWRKNVFELQGFCYYISGTPNTYFQGIYVRAKLEWWSPSHGWQAGASETQTPILDLTADITAFYDYWHGTNQSVQSNYNGSVQVNVITPPAAYTTYNYDTQRYLFSETRPEDERAFSYTVDVYGYMSNSVSINGVYQYDSSSTFSSSPGNPLW